MSRATARIGVAAALLAAAPAVAGPPCVDVRGPAPWRAEAIAALAERGLSAPTPGCERVTVTITPLDETSAVWRVGLTTGEAPARALDAAAAAAWIDSVVTPDRLAGMWAPASDPAVTRVLDVPPVAAAPPAPLVPGEPRAVTLYPSLEAWRADMPSATVEVPLRHVLVSEKLVGEPGLEPMWALDWKLGEARPHGKAFVFTVGDELFLHDGRPFAFKDKPYGRVHRVGPLGVYQREVCYPTRVGPTVVTRCDAAIRIIDLTTGEITDAKRRWLADLMADQPALLAAWDAEPKKHAGVRLRYAKRALLDRRGE